MVLGIRNEIRDQGAEGKEREGIMIGNVKYGKESWRVIEVYINGDMDRKLEELREWMEKRDGQKNDNRGDFNARTGEEGGSVERDIGEEEVKGRESKDEKINKDGKKLISLIGERGWIILNGGVR